jgi:hypothetical protein
MTWEITRLRKNKDDTQELYHPALHETGPYQVFRRFSGDEKQKSSGAKPLGTLGEVVTHLKDGYSLWMRGEETKQRNLISPRRITVRKV